MRYCADRRCSTLVERGYCPVHRRSQQRERGSQRERGYTWDWERRAALFRSRFPLCGQRPGGLAPVLSQCHDERRTTLAAVVDHVAPHRGDPALFWDELNNWQSLCRSCHSRKTAAGF